MKAIKDAIKNRRKSISVTIDIAPDHRNMPEPRRGDMNEKMQADLNGDEHDPKNVMALDPDDVTSDGGMRENADDSPEQEAVADSVDEMDEMEGKDMPLSDQEIRMAERMVRGEVKPQSIRDRMVLAEYKKAKGME